MSEPINWQKVVLRPSGCVNGPLARIARIAALHKFGGGWRPGRGVKSPEHSNPKIWAALYKYTAVECAWRRFVDKLLDWGEITDAVARSMRMCPPTGFILNCTLHTCKHRLCPWCHARKIHKVAERLAKLDCGLEIKTELIEYDDPVAAIRDLSDRREVLLVEDPNRLVGIYLEPGDTSYSGRLVVLTQGDQKPSNVLRDLAEFFAYGPGTLTITKNRLSEYSESVKNVRMFRPKNVRVAEWEKVS